MKRLLIILIYSIYAINVFAGTQYYNFTYIPKYPDPESANYDIYMDDFMDDVDLEFYNLNQAKLNSDTQSPSLTTNLIITACNLQDADGGLISCLDITWTDDSNTDVDFYEVRYKPQGATKYAYLQTTEKTLRITGLVGSTTYCIAVKVVDKQGNSSGYPTDNCTTSSGTDTSIGAPTALTATPAFGAIWLGWTNPADKDLSLIEVWRADTNDRATASKIAEVKTSYYADKLDNGITKYYWMRAKDLSGNLSAYEPIGATSGISTTTVTIQEPDIADAQITNQKIATATIDLATKVQGQLPNANLAQITDAAKLADAIISAAKIQTGAVDKTKFATNLSPIEKITTLPTLPDAAYPQGYAVFLTTDNKLYRSTGSTWTTTTATTDLSGTIATAQLADGSITTIKLGDAQVSSQKLIDGSVTSAKIGDSQVETAKLATGAVTTIKLGDLQITAEKLANGSVGKVKFATGLSPIENAGMLPTLPDSNYPEGNVVFLTTDDKLYRSTGTAWTTVVPATDITGQITGTQITDDAITSPKIAANTIVAADIAAGTVTATQIATDTITAGQIAVGAIASSELAAGAVIAGKIAAGTIVAADIATDTITATQIAASAIAASELAADSVSSSHIVAGTIAASDIAAGTITATQIAAGTITGTLIAADTIAATNIAAGAVNTSELYSDAVTTDKIAAGAVQATDIQAGAITSTHVSTNQIITSSANIGDALITSAKIVDGTIVTADIADAQITSALIADATIASADIANATITSADIANATITDANINNLSADKITAGTLTGRTIQTQGSGERIVLSANTKEARWYDSSNYVIASIGVESGNDWKLMYTDWTPSNSPDSVSGIYSVLNAQNRTTASKVHYGMRSIVTSVPSGTTGYGGYFTVASGAGEGIGLKAIGVAADIVLGSTYYQGSSIQENSAWRNIAYGVFGEINAACTAATKGAGFTVSSGGTGICNISFNTAFTSAPIVIATAGPTGGTTSIVTTVYSVSTTGTTIRRAYSDSTTLTNQAFSFFAIAP